MSTKEGLEVTNRVLRSIASDDPDTTTTFIPWTLIQSLDCYPAFGG